MLKKIKAYMMPIAMCLGIVFHSFFSEFQFLTTYLIFIMLFLTYSKLKWHEIQFTRMHLWLILIQIFGSLIVFLVIRPFNLIVAQGAMICVLAPTATSAPVIGGMLKGNVASLTAYSLLSNLCVAVMAPIIFTFASEEYGSVPFFESLMNIAKRVSLLLFLPFILSFGLRKFLPKVINKVGEFSEFSFYLWDFALIIVTARTVEFILQQDSSRYFDEIIIAALALIFCVLQFLLGRKIGKKYNDTVAGGQGLGQKNTILAIWMAQTYLNPLSSIGPGAYVLWQNMVNSFQVWRKRKSL